MQNLEIKEIDSKTEDLGVIYEGIEIPDEIKTLRMFLKDACEEAGLKWDKSFNANPDQYHIKYEYGENIRFSAGNSHYARFIIKNQYRSVEIHIIPRGKSTDKVIDKLDFEVADPAFHGGLVQLVQKMNRGYNDRQD